VGQARAIRSGVAAANAALRVVFAPPCAVCASALLTPLEGCVCARCWAAIEPPPQVPCPPGIAIAAAGGDYIGSLRHIVHAFKYDGRRSLARPLAELMRSRGSAVLRDASYVVPVPLHPWRRMRRGFNQAADLARGLELPMAPVLWRRRMTATQADLTAAQRRQNVHGAFSVSPFVARRRRDMLRDAVVVLVDDVRTTGATLQACADALESVGVREVRALTAAVRALDGNRT
jgi:ComF family protein